VLKLFVKKTSTKERKRNITLKPAVDVDSPSASKIIFVILEDHMRKKQ
jgi:hypothetical protein